jgi:hypothetical protein
MDTDYMLLGVILKGHNSVQDDRCLGAVKIFTSQIKEMTLGQFRDIIKKQLAYFLENLQFCTKEG